MLSLLPLPMLPVLPVLLLLHLLLKLTRVTEVTWVTKVTWVLNAVRLVLLAARLVLHQRPAQWQISMHLVEAFTTSVLRSAFLKIASMNF